MDDHPILRKLSPRLRPIILSWIEDAIIRDIADNPQSVSLLVPRVVDYMVDALYPEDDYDDYASEDELMELQEWDSNLEEYDWGHLVGDVLEDLLLRGKLTLPKSRSPRGATGKQLQIIRELQEDEADIAFDFCFPQLTSWMAHVIIQGLISMSEVQRCTGRREFKPGDLRKAIRDYIHRRNDD